MNKNGNKICGLSKRTIDDVLASPIRENLLHDVTFPHKIMDQRHQRYMPTNINNNNDDLHNQIIAQQENNFNFKTLTKKPSKENIPEGFPPTVYIVSPSYNILKPADVDVENNIEKRVHFNFHTKILENEIFGSNNDINESTVCISPIKSSPLKNLLNFSINTKSTKTTGLFEKSPTIPYSSATKDALLSPKKKLWLPDISAYKVLDAPGIVDDFYLKLIDWSNDNKIAVALDAKLYMYNYENENVKELIDFGRNKESVTSVAWSKIDTGKILIGTSKGRIQYWDAETDKCILQRLAHSDRIGTLDWNEHCFTSGSKDKQILHFDIRERTSALPVFSFSRHSHEICGLSWSPGGHILASGGNDNKLILWSCHNNKPMNEFRSHVAAVRALAWCPHEHGLLASGGGSADRTIKLWNTLTYNMIKSISTKSQVCNLAWSGHTKRILSTHGYNDNSISIWEYPSMDIVIKLKGHTSRVLQMAMSPDGQHAVTAAGDETVRFWKVFPFQICSKKKISSLMRSVPIFR